MNTTVRKFEVGDKEYSFKLTNRSLLKIDEIYGNYADVLLGIELGKNFYNNALKIISCCCLDRKFTFDELADSLTSDQLQNKIPNFVIKLHNDYMSVTNIEENKKNIAASQGNKAKKKKKNR